MINGCVGWVNEYEFRYQCRTWDFHVFFFFLNRNLNNKYNATLKLECSNSLTVKFHLQSYTDFMSNILYKCTLFMHLKRPSDRSLHTTSQWFDRLFHSYKKSRHIENWHRALVRKEREKCKSIGETREQVIILTVAWTSKAIRKCPLRWKEMA